MTSKAAKLRIKRERQKRGRPCKTDVPRTESGRISRAKNPDEAPDRLAKLKRVAMFGVKFEEAGVQEFGTVIGRLLKSEEINAQQYRALQRYGELAERYKAIMLVPDSLKRKEGGGVMRIPDDESEIQVREKWRDVVRVINDAQSAHRGNLMASLNYIVSRDEFHEHMLGDARVAANALVRYYGIS